jgi:hypothetical protein
MEKIKFLNILFSSRRQPKFVPEDMKYEFKIIKHRFANNKPLSHEKIDDFLSRLGVDVIHEVKVSNNILKQLA